VDVTSLSQRNEVQPIEGDDFFCGLQDAILPGNAFAAGMLE
jgi:hypothetical protein